VGQTHVLTKFCLGHQKYDAFAAINSHANGKEGSGYIVNGHEYDSKRPISLFAFFKLSAAAERTKRKMADRGVLRVIKTDFSTFDPESVEPDPKILANFVSRIKRLGDIFNCKTEDDCIALLKKYNNYAPDCVLDII
jgi:hypothetical protein